MGDTASEMEDSDTGWAEAARARQQRRDEALSAASSSREAVHNRARKLKQHYREVEACNNIMAYGFIIIILLLTGFYWFIMIFSAEIKDTFQIYISGPPSHCSCLCLWHTGPGFTQ